MKTTFERYMLYTLYSHRLSTRTLQKETRPIKRPRSKSLDQQSVKFRSFKKKRAPRPPTEMYELQSPQEEPYVTPKKPKNRPMYIRVVNAHLPVADGDSDLD